MLWHKELRDGYVFYVDIFDKYDDSLSSFETFKRKFVASAPTKNNDTVIAEYYKIDKIPNEDDDINQIIGETSKLLCHAEIGTDVAGMLYAMRAAFFAQAEEFEMCLRDIAHASQSNYPWNLWSDFKEVRYAATEYSKLQRSHADSNANDVPKLSFPAGKSIPCFAQGLIVAESKQFGKHIVTDRELDIGQTVIVEKAFCMSPTDGEMYMECANCFERKANFIPCKKCSSVIFCSTNCYDIAHKTFHAIECRAAGFRSILKTSHRFLLRTIITALQAFPNAKELMRTVDQFVTHEPGGTFYNANASIRSYMEFFGLIQNINSTPHARKIDLIDSTKLVYFIIKSDPTYRAAFKSLEASRFLAHLILHHAYVIDSNKTITYTLRHGVFKTELGMDTSRPATYAWAVFLNSSRLNHSCQPNIGRLYLGDTLVCKVIRPIKRGEQLFVSYLGPFGSLEDTSERQDYLSFAHHFECTCRSCTDDLPTSSTHSNVNADVSICRLLEVFTAAEEDDGASALVVNRNEMLKMEKSAIKYLDDNHDHNPNEETLLVEFSLMQIWNNLGR